MAFPAKQPEPAASNSKWLIFGGLGVGGLIAAALVLWLLMGGTQTLVSVLPEGVVKTLGERPGEGKKVEQKLSDYPGEKIAEKDEEPKVAAAGPDVFVAPAPEINAEELDKLLLPLQAQAKSADQAIEKVRDGHGKDQASLHEAEQAVAGLRAFSLREIPARYKAMAEQKRKALADERTEAFASAQRLARATHLVAVPAGVASDSVVLRSAASEASENVGVLDDGVLVHLHLDTGKGWARIDALTGSAAGKGGYLQSKYLRRVEPK